jgi:hypothetical protein
MGNQSVFIGPDERVPPGGGRDKHVPPKGRRGTLVVPGEGMQDQALNGGPDKRVPPEKVPPRKADVTGTFLRSIVRRGTLVVPGKRQRMIQR